MTYSTCAERAYMWQHATTKWQGMAVAAAILRTDCRSQLPQPPRLRASSTLVTSTLLSESVPCCLTQSSKIHQILIATALPQNNRSATQPAQPFSGQDTSEFRWEIPPLVDSSPRTQATASSPARRPPGRR